ncbi:MAG: hypothetical protein LBC07_01355 [Elusimicrobiota bacterium]|jgi:hypothetical protein|nr:hypothetical protein [Elusimicrobiota bacterium]
MQNTQFNKINISTLFDKEPTKWGTRGDPFLWDEMRLKSKNIKLLENKMEMDNYFYRLFSRIIGCKITDKEYILIKRYCLKSGISKGN